jgi:transcriptional regulator with XRE-family HTH domain
VPIARPCAMADLKEIVAINVRRLRYDRGWTQEDLADRVGLSERYVGQVERAQASMTITVLGRIANALEVEAAKLVTTRASILSQGCRTSATPQSAVM